VEDDHGDVFCFLDEVVDVVAEFGRRGVVAVEDVASDSIFITDVDYDVVFVGLFVALYDPSELLQGHDRKAAGGRGEAGPYIASYVSRWHLSVSLENALSQVG
jgi:hypothetical protein